MESAATAPVTLHAQGVSKKFCRTLKSSLRYGLTDLMLCAIGARPAATELRPKEFWAVDDVSLDIDKGNIVGLVGRNGCGKTTLLQLLAGIFEPDRGDIEVRGRITTLIEANAGFHPLLSVRENIFVVGALMGMRRNEVERALPDILAMADIGPSVDSPCNTLSWGMQLRLTFAMAMATCPRLLLIDEILSFGDGRFRKQCAPTLRRIATQGCILMVSHNLDLISSVCNRLVVMEQSKVVWSGADVATGLAWYRNLLKGD
jgi:lipopolysaccharide transport system ATP-binding protein